MLRTLIAVCFIFLALAAVLPARQALAAGPVETAVGQLEQPAQEDGEEEGALSPELNQILASLGIYILTMFTLALGTEIMVDVIKLAIGLKSKPTARQAMAQFRDLIPGNLENLEVDAEAEQQLQRHVAALEELLKPVVQAEDFLSKLHEGHIGTAVQAILARLDSDSSFTGKKITAHIQERMHTAMQQLSKDLGLSAYVVQPLLERFDEAIENLAGTDPRQILRWSVTFFQEGMADLVSSWARNQKGLLTSGLEEVVKQRYDQLLRPQLVGCGFSVNEIEAIDRWFEIYLQRSRDHVGQDVDVYLDSLNNLLQGVETQRYLLQSPARKAWRRLRVAPIIGPILMGVENGWNRVLGRHRPVYGQATMPRPINDITEAARIVSDMDREHREDASLRVQWLRFSSVVMAIWLAYMLQIDSADLLGGLVPAATARFLANDLLAEGTYRVFFLEFHLARHITAGILLTGLAASAGSSFWHDQLGRIQAAKQANETAHAILKQVRKE